MEKHYKAEEKWRILWNRTRDTTQVGIRSSGLVSTQKERHKETGKDTKNSYENDTWIERYMLLGKTGKKMDYQHCKKEGKEDTW